MKGNSKVRVYSVHELQRMIADADDGKTICSLVIVAIGQYAQKKLPKHALAGLLSQCGDKLFTL